MEPLMGGIGQENLLVGLFLVGGGMSKFLASEEGTPFIPQLPVEKSLLSLSKK